MEERYARRIEVHEQNGDVDLLAHVRFPSAHEGSMSWKHPNKPGAKKRMAIFLAFAIGLEVVGGCIVSALGIMEPSHVMRFALSSLIGDGLICLLWWHFGDM